VRHPQALGQQKFQLVTEALAPMAQVRALVRKLVLEELLSSSIRGNRENEIASFQGRRP
jgi:hypothetical protein